MNGTEKESRFKYEKLANNILSYFSQSRALLQVEDVEHILDENMVLLFSAEIEDGSIEQVAEQLVVMYEECLNRNYEPIDKL